MIQPIGPFECSNCGTKGRIYHIAQVTHLGPNGVEMLLTVYGSPGCHEEMKAIMDTFQETGGERR